LQAATLMLDRMLAEAHHGCGDKVQ
jgi:hypothetical protein